MLTLCSPDIYLTIIWPSPAQNIKFMKHFTYLLCNWKAQLFKNGPDERQVLHFTTIVHSLLYLLFLNVWFWFVIVFGSDWIMKIPVESRGWSPLVLKRFVLVQWRETSEPHSVVEWRRLRSSPESRGNKTMRIFCMNCVPLAFSRRALQGLHV